MTRTVIRYEKVAVSQVPGIGTEAYGVAPSVAQGVTLTGLFDVRACDV